MKSANFLCIPQNFYPVYSTDKGCILLCINTAYGWHNEDQLWVSINTTKDNSGTSKEVASLIGLHLILDVLHDFPQYHWTITKKNSS